MTKKVSKIRLALFVLLLATVGGLIVAGAVLAGGPSQSSEAPVLWSWDFMSGNTDGPAGTSNLVRTDSGISANYKTDVLTPGNAATLWFIVFNYPENCTEAQGGCSPDDLGNTEAMGDFFLASGHVIGDDGKGNFGGHLNVGDVSGSGLAEMICLDPEAGCIDGVPPESTPGLINPEGALVVLAVHDHGPKQTGQTLKEQISSFLGGCDLPFLGNEFGFATGEEDLPKGPGECSTIQFSPHPPDNN